LFSLLGIRYIGPNGKINNMIKAYEAARNDILVISDSSIKSKLSRTYKLKL